MKRIEITGHLIKSFYGFGFGSEKFNSYEYGMSRHIKIYLGPVIILITVMPRDQIRWINQNSAIE